MSNLINIATKPVVSVVLPCCNNFRYTAQVFASLARVMEGLPYEIIVVDNGSTDETLSFIGSHTSGQLRGHSQGKYPPVWIKLLHNPKRRALSKSWNMGCHEAQGAYLLVSNNDVIYTPGSVQALVQALKEEWQYGIALPSNRMTVRGVVPPIKPLYSAEDNGADFGDIIAANLHSVEEYGVRSQKTGKVRNTPEAYIPQGGYCFMTTPRVYKRVGDFDEDYELTGEDYDWFARNRRHFKMVLAEDAYVEHFEHTTCKEIGSEYNERLCLSRFLLTEKQEGMSEMFSIVMPNFNRVEQLEIAIDSVLAQTFKHWRLYIMDDGSDRWDEITRLSKKYDGHRNRIWWFRNASRNGPGATRNSGLRLSKGKYVAFLDSDDIWYPHHLERHWEAHETGDWGMVYSNPDFANRYKQPDTGRYHYKAREHPTIKYMGEYDKDRLAKHNYIQTSSMTIWGELARGCFFSDKLVGEDWDYVKAIADVAGDGRPVKHLDESTCRYHITQVADEEDHLVKRDVPSLSDLDAPDTSRVVAPLPDAAKLGIVIATRDRNAQLTACLRSVGAAACVVVDDGGGNLAITAAVAVGAGNCGLIRLDENMGQSAARNRGIEQCRFEWVQFLDDDDLLTGDWALRLLPELSDNVDVITFPAFVPGPNGFVPTNDTFTSQICVRRSMLLEVGSFNEALHFEEDRDLLDRLRRHGARMVHLPFPLVYRPSRGGTGLPGQAEGEAASRRVVVAGNWKKPF